ncbi:MAG: sigma 54-interacting transcriptional regulator, partial [Myxococcota bacterium]
MSEDDTQATLPRAARAPIRRERQEVVLTVLAHFDVSYVGALARVAPRVELSRKAPEFTLLSGEERALGDPFLSRKPLRVGVEDEEVVLDAGAGAGPVRLDGRLLDAKRPRRLRREELDEGVVLELDGRVAVLLHRRVVLPRVESGDMGLVGVSEGMQRLRATVRKVAPTPLSVLICGDSGTGKELIAGAVHRASERSARPLETLNMAAVTPSLAASELFGHSRGAFTGAKTNHVGAFERADGGSLFLDEIGDTPGEMQPLLLRALEAGEIMPVGASTPRTVDVRVIAATDVDLEAAIAAGDFRTSLLHRLSGFRIDVPPLSGRREDIGLLVVHFLRQELERIGAMRCLEPDPHRSWLSATTLARMARYAWPGNV